MTRKRLTIVLSAAVLTAIGYVGVESLIGGARADDLQTVVDTRRATMKDIGAQTKAIYAVVNVALIAIAMGGGKAGLYAMFGTFFFMSVMFPTIFALGIRGLGDYTKLGSSLIVMSIVGGAIAAPFMGHIADVHSIRTGFVVPLVCFAFIALYGSTWARFSRLDSLPSAR